MTRRNLILAITEETGLPQLQVRNIVQKVFATIVETLIKEGRVELRNFGVFKLQRRKARMARNPRTGENRMVPERYTVILKPGKAVAKRINDECRRKAVSH
jgi:integration host factor subunit beta